MTSSERAAGDLVAKAHARLLADSSLQFHFTRIDQPKPPSWLPELVKLLQALGPILKIVFWIGLAVLAAWLVYGLARAVLRLRRRPPAERPTGPSLGSDPARLAPGVQKALALLEEADRLAAENRFGEAAHVLLFRTIADLETRRPRTLAPALTSRDIARLTELPAAARDALAIIVRHVEQSFFGGRALDSQDFAVCRGAYQTFASPASWAAGGRG